MRSVAQDVSIGRLAEPLEVDQTTVHRDEVAVELISRSRDALGTPRYVSSMEERGSNIDAGSRFPRGPRRSSGGSGVPLLSRRNSPRRSDDFQIRRTPDADSVPGAGSRNAATQYANGRRDHRDIAGKRPRRRSLVIARG
jgi:hypothetical protein